MNEETGDRSQLSVQLEGITFKHKDIFAVVDDFYTRVQLDPVLSVPFRSVHDWPDHIRRLTHFWWIRFGGKPYMPVTYNPVAKHFLAGFNDEFLARWLGLFHETLKKHLTHEQYEFWKLVSERMGQALSMKNELIKSEHERRHAPKPSR